MKNLHLKHILELNVAILLISTSGVLGKFVSMPPPVTIWFRCVFAVVILGAYCWYNKIDLKIYGKRDFKAIFLSSLLFGAHWITYFYALQLSNVAIGMLSLFTYPVITALLEPLFFKTTLNKTHILLGVIALIGIYFLAPEFNLESNITKGVLFGLLSSVFYAIRNIMMKQKIAQYQGSMLIFYQMLIVSLVLWPVLFLFEVQPTSGDWMAIIALALFTTAVGHTLFVRSFKNFSIGTASIMSSVQPVYGVLFGLFLLNEIPSENTLIGGFLILSTVVIESIQSNKRK
ncbi:MAG: DMT family transporter [Lutibacter sp.]|nr:DMT family transporter [Lutibacter sp.]